MKRVGFVSILILVLLVFTLSDSSAQIGFKGVGGRLGFVNADASQSGIIFGAHVNLGEIIPGLAIVPSLDYWSDDLDFLSINGNVRYYFPSGGNIDLFAVGGLGFVRVSVPEVTVPGFGTVGGGSSTEIGLNLGGGAEIPLSDNLKGSAMLIFNTEASQIKIMGGVTYMLGQ